MAHLLLEFKEVCVCDFCKKIFYMDLQTKYISQVFRQFSGSLQMYMFLFISVTHGCIVATLKLYLPDGKEAKAR